MSSILSGAKNLSEDQYQSYVNALQYDIKKYQDTYDKKSYNQLNDWKIKYDPFLALQGTDAKVEYADDKNNYDRHYDLGRSKALKSLLYDFMDARNSKDEATDNKQSGAGSSSNSGLSNLADSLTKVVGSAQAPRNIYVNIDSFNKGGINTQNTSLQNMDENQIEDWFTNMCMRAVRNVELSYQ